ncbi:MAG: hypothetical protein H6862_05725 [Rhodospirillales bacterium]|nr:hypothetical protein [Rhodospirillales bacterium]
MGWGWRKTLVAGSFLGGLLGGASDGAAPLASMAPPPVGGGWGVGRMFGFGRGGGPAAALWDATHTSPFERNHPVLAERLDAARGTSRFEAALGERSFVPGARLAAVAPLTSTFATAASGLGSALGQGLNAAFSSPEPSAGFDQPSVANRGGPSFGGGFNNV